MITSLVIDPDALKAEYFCDDPKYGLILRSIFNSIIDRKAVLIVDSTERLKNKISRMLAEVGSECEEIQEINTLYDEILNSAQSGGQKLLIECRKEFHKCKKDTPLGELINKINHVFNVNKFITADQSSTASNRVLMGDFFREKEDRKIIKKSRDFHFAETSEQKLVKTKLGNVLKYASQVEVYDPNLGKIDTIESFLDGVNFILGAFKLSSVYSSKKVNFTFYTLVEAAFDEESETREAIGKKKKSKDAIKKLERGLNRLFGRYQNYDYELKEFNAKKDKFHARYLNSAYFVLNVEAGLQLFNRNKKFKINSFGLKANEANREINKIKQLPVFSA